MPVPVLCVVEIQFLCMEVVCIYSEIAYLLYFLCVRLQNTVVPLLPAKARSEPEHPALVAQERPAFCCHPVSTAPLILDYHRVLQLS